MHGDFVNGWDTDILQKAADNCNDSLGRVEQCPYFKFFPNTIQNDCVIPPRVDEQTTGWMDNLPGCNELSYGPDNAVPKNDCGATKVVGEPKQYSTDMSAKGWEYVGCVLDTLDNRTLPIRTGAPDMTIEKCIDYCVGKGQIFAGLEYSNECYCGNTVASDRLGYRRCRMTCAGNPNQYCGDAQRLSIYKIAGGTVKDVTSTLTIPTATQTTLTKSTIKPTGTPGPTSIPTGWVARDCYSDPVTPRALSNRAAFPDPVTNPVCVTYCDTKGFKFAATEYGNECFCGNTLVGSTKTAITDCNMNCEGDATQKCGGPKRMTLYEKTTTTKKPKPKRNSIRSLWGKYGARRLQRL